METVTAPRRQTESEAVFDWRLAELRRLGLSPDAAWMLACERDVDIRQAERLFAQGCPVETLLEILL